MHVLTIDQAPTSSTMLQHHGYTVCVARGVEQAWALASMQRFDLVLVAERAGGNALRLCADLREHMSADVIIMLLLANDTPLRRVTAMQLGADDVVGLPCDPHELLARIEAHRCRRALDTT